MLPWLAWNHHIDQVGFTLKDLPSSSPPLLPQVQKIHLVKSVCHVMASHFYCSLVFLVTGIIFMMGSMALIILDWIYNPPNPNHH